MKGTIKRKAGGKAESPKSGDKSFDQDLKSKPEARVKAPKIDKAASARKSGGRTAHADGGSVPGAATRANGGRAPRKAGGRTGSNMNPLSSAHKGSSPKGHSTPGSTD